MTDYSIGVRFTADGKALYGELRTASGEIRRFSTEGAQAASTAARGFDGTRSSIRGVGEQLRRTSGELRTASGELRRFGSGVSAELRSAGGELRAVGSELRRFSAEGAQAAGKVSRDFDRMRSSISGVGEQLRRARSELIAFFSVRGAIELARTLGAIADSYANIQGKLRTVTQDTAQLGAVTGRVFEIAQRTGTALDATAALAVKNTRVFLSLGLTNEVAQQRGLRLTETIQKALAVSGATASEASSLVQQLGQALQSGVLQGDEFRSVMENGGRVVQALTEHTGKSVGELRKLAEQGKLTSQVVLDALSASADKIDTEFGRNVPVTLARAWQQLQNAITRYVGEADQASGTTRAIAQTIIALGRNLDTVATALGVVAATAAIALGSRFLGLVAGAASALRAKAAAAIQSRAALLAETEMHAASSAALVRSTVARTTDLQATLQTIAAARQDATAQLASATARATTAQRTIEAARAAGPLSAALRLVRDSEVQLTAAERTRSAAIAELAALGRAQAAVEAELAAATNAQIAAQTRAAAADTAAAAATSRLTMAKTLLTSAGSSLLALIGGWPTVVMAAGVALVYLATRTTAVSEEVDRLAKRAAELEARVLSLTDALFVLSRGTEPLKKSLLEVKEAQLQELNAARERAGFNGELLKSFQGTGFAIARVRHEIDQLREAEATVNLVALKAHLSDFVRLISGAATAGSDWRKRLTSDVSGISRSLSDDVEKHQKAVRELGKTQEQIAEINRQREIDQKAQTYGIKQGTEAYKMLTAEVTKAYAPLVAAAAAHDRATAAKKAQTAAASALTKAENTAESATSRLATAQGQLADFISRAAGELSPAARVASTYEQRLRDIAAAGGKAIQALRDHAKATKDHTGLAAAEAQIQNQVTAAIAAATAQRDLDAAAIKRQGDVLTRYVEQLKRDYADAGMNDRQRAIAQAVAEATREWERNRDAHIANGQTLEELQKKVGATAGSLYDQAAALDRARDSAQRYGQIIRSAFEGAIDAVADWAVSGFRNAKEFWKGMVDQVKRGVAQMLAEWAKTKIIGWLTGNTTGGVNWAGMMASAFGVSSGGGGAGGNVGGTIAQIGMDYATGGSGGGTSFGGVSAGTWAPWLGAVAGAYLGSQRGDGGVGTAGATVAYAGLGYTMGSLALSAAATVSAAAAATATAAAATSAAGVAAAGAASSAAAGAGTAAAVGAGGTAISGAAVAIPIIGWVLAIIAAIDYASGGKVFGTKYRPERSTVSLALGPEGGDASASIDEWKYRRNILQFNRGGSLEAMRRFGEINRRHRDVETTPEMERAADELFTSIQQVMVDSARRIAIETPPMLDAALNTVVEYDKKGKVKATKYFVEVLGKVYEEATSDLAVMRLAAEAQIAVVSAATAGEASRIAEAYRYNAERLADAAGFLVAAQADIARGHSLLGRGASLTNVSSIVKELARAGETLTATYSRLLVSTQSIRDAFGLAGASLNKFGAELVRFGNEVAEQAGGSDAAKELWQNFFSNFYTAAELNQYQIDQLKPELAAGLTTLGLKPDITMEEFKAEFERRLPTLTAAQVVQWLRFGDILATVTKLVDKNTQAQEEQARQLEAQEQSRQQARASYADIVVGMDQQIAALAGKGMSAFVQTLAQIGANAEENRRRLNELARAAGLAGAREEDLARTHTLAAAQAAQAAKQLELASIDIAKELFGSNAQAAGIATGRALHSVADGIRAIRDAAQQFRDSMLLDDQLSPLNARQQLDEALRQLRATGDEGVARRALEIGRGLTATGADWRTLFDQITGLVRPRASDEGDGGGGFDASTIEQQMSPADRLAMAQQLARNVADLSGFSGKTFEEVAKQLGFSLDQLGSELGLQGDALKNYLNSLKASSYTLTDLGSVIAKQVDRIIAALTPTGTLAPGKPDTGPIVEGPFLVHSATPPPKSTASAPSPKPGNKPARADSGDAQAIVDAVAGMAERVELALREIARITASTGEANEDAIQRIESVARDGVRETRRLTEAVLAGGGSLGPGEFRR